MVERRRRRTGRVTDKKRAALDKLKKLREGKLRNVDQESDDESDNDDIYDVVDEKEYRKIVKERRSKGDFVVDDDGT